MKLRQEVETASLAPEAIHVEASSNEAVRMDISGAHAVACLSLSVAID